MLIRHALRYVLGAVAPIQYIVPGTTALGAWAATDPALLGIGTQGTADQYGYAERACGGWTTRNHDRITGSGTYYVGATFWKAPTAADNLLGKYRGMKEVWFSFKNGPWMVVTEPAVHPELFNETYLAPVRASDVAASGPGEWRAIGVPLVGVPFVLQGFPDPKTQNNDGVARMNYVPDMWSLVMHVDKTGTDLPHAKIYIGPAGNDANSGQTSALPVATWEVAETKLKALNLSQGFSNTDVGGCEIIMLAGMTTYGKAGTPGIMLAANMPLIVRADDGLNPGSFVYDEVLDVGTFTNGDVHLTTTTLWGLNCEKIRFKNFSKSCFLANRDESGSSINAQNYFDNYLDSVFHDGGAGLDAFGQYNGPVPFGCANGYQEVINCGFYRFANGGLNKITLGINVKTVGSSENGDIWNNPKVLINAVCGRGQDLTDGNHLDALQYYQGRSMHIVEDFYCRSAWNAQCVLLTNNNHKDFALVRLRLDNSGSGGYAAFLMAICQNVYILDPQIAGAIQPSPTGAPYNVNCRVVMVSGSSAPTLVSARRYGLTVLYPTTPSEPADGVPPPDLIYTLFGADVFIDIDADASATIVLDGETLNVTSWEKIGGGSPFVPRAVSPPPTYDSVGLNLTSATVDFNGINTGADSGAAMLKSGSNPEIEGYNAVEIFMVLDQRDVLTQTALRHIAAYGGSTTTSNRAIFKGVPTGGRNIAQWSCPNTSSSTSNRLTAPGDFSGNCVIHCYLDPVTNMLGIGLFNAAQNVWSLSYYTTAAVVGTILTGAIRHCIAHPAAGGSPFAKIGLNRYTVIKRTATAAERESAVNFLLGRALAA